MIQNASVWTAYSSENGLYAVQTRLERINISGLFLCHLFDHICDQF